MKHMSLSVGLNVKEREGKVFVNFRSVAYIQKMTRSTADFALLAAGLGLVSGVGSTTTAAPPRINLIGKVEVRLVLLKKKN